MAIGPKESLGWPKSSLENAWEIKAEFLGPRAEGCPQEMCVFKGTFRWAGEGFEYEPPKWGKCPSERPAAITAPTLDKGFLVHFARFDFLFAGFDSAAVFANGAAAKHAASTFA